MSFTVPTTDAAVRAITVTATLGTLSADTQLFTGRSSVLLHVEPERDVGASGESLPLRLRAEDLGGGARPEDLSVEVFGSDGNRAVGAARWTGRARVEGEGTARATLSGAGPWWVAVRSTRDRNVSAGTVVWERARPPTLGARGSLSVRASTSRAAPGVTLPVDVVRPAGGATWVTLEQSGVWASAVIPAGAAPRPDGSWRAMLNVPETARGDLSVVATHLHAGAVQTATSVTRAVGSPATLTVEPERRVYPEGERMTVTVSSRDAEGHPVDGVISLWLADAGYWDLAEERYPEPEALLNVPGRPASGSDSTHFIAWGSDEGRHVDVSALWNGAPLPRTTLYDAWTAGAETVDVRATGSLAVIARAIATRAGLRLGEVCDARVRAVGDATLSARNIPWDLLAARVGERTETAAVVDGQTLSFSCDHTIGHAGHGVSCCGTGSGTGYGMGGLGARHVREQTLEGDLYFLPTRRLGPTGRAVIEVPLPSHPGRWRLQGVVISDDGRGAHAHALVTTSRALTASVDLPSRMRVSDEARGALSVHCPSRAGQSVSLALSATGVTVTPPPATVTLDARGDATVPLSLTATRDGDGEVVATVTSGTLRDAVRVPLPVRDDVATRALSVRSFVGESATDVDVPIPALARPASLRVSVDAGLADIFDDVVSALSQPRWEAPVLYVDRLLALRALESSLAALPEPERTPRAARVDAMVRSTLATLNAMRGPDGGVAWWRAPSSSPWLTAVTLAAIPTDGRGPWADAVRLAAQSAPTSTGDLRAALADALSHGDASERATATTLLRSGPRDGGFTLDGLARGATTARRLAIPAADQRAWTDALRAALDATTAQPAAAPCRGVAWFLCMNRDGDRGRVARAALALTELGALDAGGRARAITWLGLRPSERRSWTWGSAEADVLALLSRSPVSRAGARFVVRAGDRVLGRGEGAVDVTLPAGGATTLRVSFEAARGRATRARVEGAVTMAAPDATLGTAALERRVDVGADGPSLTLRWTLPRETTGVELRVPMPSGVDLARPGGARARVRASERDVMWWSVLDRAPRALSPVIERDDGAIVLRMERLGAGAHALTLPLVFTAAGHSRAGGATLRSDDPEVWGMTAPVEVQSPTR
ncbi:MAG: alpha-2-macroglobulin family protein [Polyangiales bacterium]